MRIIRVLLFLLYKEGETSMKRTIIIFILAFFIGAGTFKLYYHIDKENKVNNYFSNLYNENAFLIEASDLAKKLKQNGQEILLVDVRKANEYTKGHIPGAVNSNWSKFDQNFQDLPKDKVLIIYCDSGEVSVQLASFLRLKGFKAYFLQGGWQNGWIPFYTSRGS